MKVTFFHIIFVSLLVEASLCYSNKVEDSLTIVSLVDSARVCQDHYDLEKSFQFINSAKKIAVKSKLGSLLYMAEIFEANLEMEKGNYVLSQKIYVKLLNYYSKLNSKKELAIIYGSLGLTQSYMSDFPNALKNFYKALNYYQELKDSVNISGTLSNIAVVFWSEEQFDDAIKFLNQSIQILEKTNKKEMLATNYGNLALYYSSKNEIEKAIRTYSKTIELAKQINDINCLANAYNNLGLIMQDKGLLDSALSLQYLGLKYRKDIKMSNGYSSSYANIGKIYFEKREMGKAISNALMAYEYANEFYSIEDLEDCTKLIADIYERNGDYFQSLIFYKKYKAAHDSIFNSINSAKITKTKMDYEFQSEQQKELIEEQKKNNEIDAHKSIRNFSLMLLISALIIIIVVYNSLRILKRNNQKLIEKNLQLHILNREKDALTNILAHDLKTPIGQLNGLAQLLEMVGSLNAEQQKILAKMNTSVKSGYELIESLINVNKLEGSNFSISKKEVNMSALVSKTVESFKSVAIPKFIDISSSITYYGTVFSSEEYLQDILNNLVSNAIKFSNANSFVKVECFSDDQFVFVQVKDNGQGFSDEDKSQLFGKYQKLSAVPTGGESSTGLGLYIVKLLGEQIQVDIKLESTQNIGSVFTISIKRETNR